MKILISGGCGFIGSNICEFLHNLGIKIISVDNLSKKYSYLNQKRLSRLGIKNFKLDVSKNSFQKINFKADIIIACCAEPAVESSRNNVRKIFQNNLVTTLNILEKARKDNSKIIFLSTSRVFSIAESYKLFKSYKKNNKIKYLFNENTSIHGPKTLYGFSKISSEFLVEEYSYAYGIKYIINRLGLIAGNWQFGKVEQGLVSLWMWRHLNKIPLVYKGYHSKGDQIRDVLFIDDLNNLILKQINKFNLVSNQLFCVGGGVNNYFNLKQLTSFCENITGNKVNIYKDKITSKYDIPYYITDTHKVNNVYKWKPLINLNDGLKKIFDWMSKNKKTIKSFF
jgi:CDP-paratose 2-epimerase